MFHLFVRTAHHYVMEQIEHVPVRVRLQLRGFLRRRRGDGDGHAALVQVAHESLGACGKFRINFRKISEKDESVPGIRGGFVRTIFTLALYISRNSSGVMGSFISSTAILHVSCSGVPRIFILTSVVYSVP